MADFTDKAALGTRRMNPSSMVPGSSSNAPQGGFRTQLRSDASAAGSGAAPKPTLTMPQNTQVVQPAPVTPDMQAQLLAQQLNAGGTPRPGQRVSSQMGRVPRVQLPMQTFEHTGQSGPMINDFHKTGAPADMSSLPTDQQAMLPSQTPAQQKKRSFKSDDFNMLSAIFKTLGEQ